MPRPFELIWNVAIAKKIQEPLHTFTDELEAEALVELDTATTPAVTAAAAIKGAKKKKAMKDAEETVKKKKAELERQVRKKVASKKSALEKEATIYFQRRFEGPLGKGLRLFHPEPAKGGNSNTGENLVSVFMILSVFFNPSVQG